MVLCASRWASTLWYSCSVSSVSKRFNNVERSFTHLETRRPKLQKPSMIRRCRDPGPTLEGERELLFDFLLPCQRDQSGVDVGAHPKASMNLGNADCEQ